MDNRHPPFSKDEFIARGYEIYETRIRPVVEAENHGRIVVIDVATGEYEMADDSLTASDRLLARLPDAKFLVLRIGHSTVHQFGSARLRKAS